jgi:hypothetical protein
VKKLPEDRSERLDLVGKLLFGKSYRRKLAKACGVSPSLAYKWPPDAEYLLNMYLYAAVKAEEIVAQKRVKQLNDLRHQLFLLPRTAQ